MMTYGRYCAIRKLAIQKAIQGAGCYSLVQKAKEPLYAHYEGILRVDLRGSSVRITQLQPG